MGSAVLVSKKLHRLHHLVRHACAYVYPCRRNLLTSVNEREKILEICTTEMEKALDAEVSHSLSEREREVFISLYKREREVLIRLNEREGEREAAADSYLVQYSVRRHDDKGNSYNVSGTQYCLLSTKTWAQTPLRIFQLPHPNTRYRWSYVTSACGGLLHFLDDKETSEEGGKNLLWMPLTNQLKIIAPSKLPRLPNAAKILYDSFGLGFDSKSQDYKVIRLIHHYFGDHYYRDPELHRMQAELYSFKTDSWKEILDFPLSLDCGDLCSRVHVNGCYYWRFFCSDPEEEIFSFNFTTEKFTCLALPPQAQADWDHCDLVGVDGRLGCFMYRDGMQSVELWVLEEDDERRSYSWARSDFEMDNVAGAKNLVMYDSDADGGLLFIRGVDMGLMVYHIRTGKLEKITTTNQCVHHVSRNRPSFPPLISS